jgi:hypothetical protein
MIGQKCVNNIKRFKEIRRVIKNDKNSKETRENAVIKLMVTFSLHKDLSVKMVCMRGMIDATKDASVREKGMEALSSVLVSTNNKEPMYACMLKKLGEAIKRNAYMNPEILEDFVCLLKGCNLTTMTQRRMVFRSILMTATHEKDHYLRKRAVFALTDVYDCIPLNWQSRVNSVLSEE